MMKFLVGLCEQHPMLRDGTVLRSSAVTIGTKALVQFYTVTSKIPPPYTVKHFNFAGTIFRELRMTDIFARIKFREFKILS